MNDIYKTPESKALENPAGLSVWKNLLCTFLSLFTATIYFLSYQAIPQFKKTFSGFGTELPVETVIALKLYPFCWWLMFLSLVPALIWLDFKEQEKVQGRLFSISALHAGCAVLWLLFVAWAMYAPVLQL